VLLHHAPAPPSLFRRETILSLFRWREWPETGLERSNACSVLKRLSAQAVTSFCRNVSRHSSALCATRRTQRRLLE
jgi:hypothetical protein